MEELLFFGVIIFFSIIESVARSRKAKRAAESPELAKEDAEFGHPDVDRDWMEEHVGPQRGPLPTYDQDASYDDMATRSSSDVATRPTQNRERGESESMRPSSEGGGLFDELAELAGQLERSRAEARTIRLPKQSPALPVPAKRGPLRPVETHRVHRAHAGYGTDPSTRARSEQDGLDPLATYLSEDAKAIRSQLRSKNPSELRRAIILHEVLGPPVSLREGGL